MDVYTKTQEYARQQKQQADDEQEKQLLKWEIQAFRENLDERTRRIFGLRLDHGKSSLEIAALVGERDDNVRTILFRTHRKLKETLVERGYAHLASRPASNRRSAVAADASDESQSSAHSKKTKGAAR